MRNVAVITAAGEGKRLPGAVAKQFRPLEGKPLLVWTIEKFEQSEMIHEIILVVRRGDLAYARETIVDRFGFKKVSDVVPGGDTRFESILHGLKAVPDIANLVFIHDGVRPFVTVDEIERVGRMAEEHDAAILAIPQAETLKRVEGDFVISTLDRTRIWIAQTPQVFKYEAIISAYIQGLEQDREFSDDAAVCEAFGISVRVAEGNRTNIKITTPEDLELARVLLRGSSPK
jgi:2-C-methyl-D-erythritol 4-phosphate cytidylyltransferase